MKHWHVIAFLVFIYSCEKDNVSFKYNALDPEAGERVIFLDSINIIIVGSENYVVGYYHIDKKKIFFPEGIAAIGHYRNDTLIHKVPFPESSNVVFYDFMQLPPGNYTYSMRFINPDNEAGMASNSITLARP